MCAVGRIHIGIKVAFCLMHISPSHYHLHADLLTCNERMGWKILEAWDYMGWTDPFNLGGRGDIFITHLIILIKSGVSTFLIVVIISVVVCLRWLYHHTLSVSYISGEIWVSLLVLVCSLMMYANNRIRYGQIVVFVCLHIALLSLYRCVFNF